ncbi:hypothetical protein [Citrobacter freundii]|uniref:hypothetical protein n=1 Tax=Citrobacter freundii TaxID=546 RepID=UPI001904AB94|nr:hypothetical protein [Citrobacter freundii]MBJ8931646.1 hypothetical protein [Citrobacter freundii]
MNKTLENWLNHYHNLIPRTWEKLSTEMLDSATLSAWLTYFEEDEDLYSTTKEKIILEMISSWLNSGKKAIHLRIPDTNLFIGEFSTYPASGIDKKCFGTTASIIFSDNECITALTSIRYNTTTQKIYVNTCRFMEDHTHLTSHCIDNTTTPIAIQLNNEHNQRKTMLGFNPSKEKKMVSMLDENFKKSCVILFAQL